MAITLIIEDGTGITGANSYIDASYAASYFELQGSDLWCSNSNKRNLALVQASIFLDLRYSARFCGLPLVSTQGLLFPRLYNGVSTGLPKTIKNACAHLALQFMEQGNLDLNANSDAAIASQSVAVAGGAVQESITYFKESGKTAFSQFAVADRYINQALETIGCAKTNTLIRFIEAVRS